MDRAMHMEDLEADIADEENALRNLLDGVMKDPVRAAVEIANRELVELIAELQDLVTNSARDQGTATRGQLEEHVRRLRKLLEGSNDKLEQIEAAMESTAQAAAGNAQRLHVALDALAAALSERSTRLESQVAAASRYLEQDGKEREERVLGGFRAAHAELQEVLAERARADAQSGERLHAVVGALGLATEEGISRLESHVRGTARDLEEAGTRREDRVISALKGVHAELEEKQQSLLDATGNLAAASSRSESQIVGALMSRLEEMAKRIELQGDERKRQSASHSAALRRLTWFAAASLVVAICAAGAGVGVLLRFAS